MEPPPVSPTCASNGKHVYRSVFISDIHLGAHASKAVEANQFVSLIQCDRLYLVGDIFDGWVGAGAGKWKPVHSSLIQNVLNLSKQGMSVMYTPGNHDSALRRFNGAELGNTIVDHSFEHFTPDGKRLLVVHGDLFDKTITNYHSLAYLSAWGYELMQMSNGAVNNIRSRRRLRPIDYCSKIKRTTKKLIKGTKTFEQSLVKHARANGYDGIICGHVHRPLLDLQTDGFIYGNCGDWVEHCTALVEHLDGRFELLWWKDIETDLGENANKFGNATGMF